MNNWQIPPYEDRFRQARDTYRFVNPRPMFDIDKFMQTLAARKAISDLFAPMTGRGQAGPTQLPRMAPNPMLHTMMNVRRPGPMVPPGQASPFRTPY